MKTMNATRQPTKPIPENSSLSRRAFVAGGSATVAATACSAASLPATSSQRQLRMAIVGAGSRASFTWGQEVVKGYSDVVEIVGLCDHNGKRVAAAQKLIGTAAPTFTDFDRVIKETGGSDTSLHDLIFRGLPKDDPLGLRAEPARGRTGKHDRHRGAPEHRTRRPADQD